MRKSIWIVPAMFFLFSAIGSPRAAWADETYAGVFTYTTPSTLQTIQLSYVATTNGMTGILNPCTPGYFTGGTVTIDNVTTKVISTIGPMNNASCSYGGAALGSFSATASLLTWDFTAPSSVYTIASTTGNDASFTLTSSPDPGTISVTDSSGNIFTSAPMSGTLTLVATPEPGTLIMLLTGLLGLGAVATMKLQWRNLGPAKA